MANKRKSRGWIPWVATIGMVVILAVMWYSEDIFVEPKPAETAQTGAAQSSALSSTQSASVFSDAKTDTVTQQAEAKTDTAVSSTASTVRETETITAQDIKEYIVREPLVNLKGGGKDSVTVLVYMNGSDLETQDGEATADLGEMVAAGSGGNVHVAVETLGTKRWRSTYGISNKTAQRYEVTGRGLTLVADNLGSVSVGDADSLADFIQWGAETYPADRYILVMWDHGAGPVYGYGYDDKTGSGDTLTAYEIRKALSDAGVTFDIIGMDCCIMSSLELCCALYDFCDYTILSEDFESGYGWYYTDWIKMLRSNSSVSSLELGTQIVDSTVNANKRYRQDSILSLIDEAYMKALYTAWVNFAYANEQTLIGTNYSKVKTRRSGGRISPILAETGYFADAGRAGSSGNELKSYFVTDILSVAQNVQGEEAEVLTSVLSRAIAYMNAYGSSANLTGLCVTLPYGDANFYKELKQVFGDCGFDADYISWLYKFVSAGGSSTFYDYDEWDQQWNETGWNDYYEEDDEFDWLYGLLGGYDDYYGDYYFEDYDNGGGGWGWTRH